jgi:hypothetical protein
MRFTLICIYEKYNDTGINFLVYFLSAIIGQTLVGASEGQQRCISRDCAIIDEHSRGSL